MVTKKLNKFEWAVTAVIAISILIFSGTYCFRSIEWSIYNLGIKVASNRKANDNIIVVAIDDKSIKQLGEWPWSRDLLTNINRQLSSARVAVVGYTLPFNKPQNNFALEALRDFADNNQKQLGNKVNLVNNVLIQLNTDRTFSYAIKKTKSVLAIPFIPAVQDVGNEVSIPKQIISYTLADISFKDMKLIPEFLELDRPIYANAISPPLEIFVNSASKVGIHAATSVTDGNISAPPLAVKYGEYYLPSFELQMASQSFELRKIPLRYKDNIAFGDNIIPVDQKHRIYPFYYTAEDGAPPFKIVSFVDLFNKKVDRKLFKNKTVLIGHTSEENVDFIDAPNGERIPPVEASAHIISSLINGDLYQITRGSYIVRYSAFIFAILYVIFILPHFRLTTGWWVTIILFITGINIEFLLMTTKSTWVPLGLPMCILVIGYILQTSKRLIHKRLEHYQSELSNANHLLGQAYQTEGQLDRAFEQYQKCHINRELLSNIYNLGLDYERKRQFNKAVQAFKYISTHKPNYKDIQKHIEKNLKHGSVITLGNNKNNNTASTLVLTDKDIAKPMLSRYQIERELGNGAMGTVYLGKDPKINRTVAIKTMGIDNNDDTNMRDFKKRFYREAETAGRLNHPNIVTIYDVGEEQDLAYIAMDYLKGKPLSDFIKSGKLLPLKDVVTIAIQVADALDYAHKNNVVHRDIKPANIIYDRSKKSVKITDFGVAHITDMSHTSTGTILGTPYYMSPEQLAGKKLDGRSDIFSLGITLFQLFTGDLPFSGDSLSNLMYNIANKRHTDIKVLKPNIPACIKTIINKCLQKEKSKRYQNGAELSKALRNCKKNI